MTLEAAKRRGAYEGGGSLLAADGKCIDSTFSGDFPNGAESVQFNGRDPNGSWDRMLEYEKTNLAKTDRNPSVWQVQMFWQQPSDASYNILATNEASGVNERLVDNVKA